MKTAGGKDAGEVLASLDDDASRKLAMLPGRHVVTTINFIPMLPPLPAEVQGEGSANSADALPAGYRGGELKRDADGAAENVNVRMERRDPPNTERATRLTLAHDSPSTCAGSMCANSRTVITKSVAIWFEASLQF